MASSSDRAQSLQYKPVEIPRILHRVVLPPMRPTGHIERFWAGFRRDNPNWALQTWDDPSPSLWPLTGHLFEQCLSAAQIADLMRLEILWNVGGVYVDTDCESVRPLDPLITTDTGLFLGAEDDVIIGTSVIGSITRHPGIGDCLGAALKGFDPSLPPDRTTGPHLIMSVLAHRSDVTIYPPYYFYPEPIAAADNFWFVRQSASDFVGGGSYVVHRWAASWVPPRRPVRRVAAYARRVWRAGCWAAHKVKSHVQA